VIRDWPPGLIARLKEVIKLRFGDERYTAPSIMEAMQNLGFWPLDAVTRAVLTELGNADVNSESDLRNRLDKLRHYSFYVLARGSEHDFKCIPSLSRRRRRGNDSRTRHRGGVRLFGMGRFGFDGELGVRRVQAAPSLASVGRVGRLDNRSHNESIHPI
jgi:hypothetical protein